MIMYVSVTLVGRLAGDPELRFTASGVAVASLTVVTSRRTKEGDQWVDKDTTFWRCSAFGEFAERIVANLYKGDAVVMYGQAFTSKWQTRDGENRERTEVRLDAGGLDFRWSDPAADPQPKQAKVKTSADDANDFDDEPGF